MSDYELYLDYVVDVSVVVARYVNSVRIALSGEVRRLSMRQLSL